MKIYKIIKKILLLCSGIDIFLGVLSLIVAIVVSFWFVGYIVFFFLPIIIPIWFFLFFIGIKRFKSLKSFDISEPVFETLKNNNLINDKQDEVIILSIFGILRMRDFIGNKFDYISGTGNIPNPENSLIFTNKRILCVMIPVMGANKNVANVVVGFQQVIWNKKHIKELGEKMISSMTPQQIFEYSSTNIAINYSDIEKVKIVPFWGRGIRITTKDGKMFRYGISNKNDLESIKRMLLNYIPSNIIE